MTMTPQKNVVIVFIDDFHHHNNCNIVILHSQPQQDNY